MKCTRKKALQHSGMDSLPSDLLADVLASLECRTELACAECVCKLWQSLTDEAIARHNTRLPADLRWLPHNHVVRLQFATRLSQMWHARSVFKGSMLAAGGLPATLNWMVANMFTSPTHRRAADQAGAFRAVVALLHREDTHASFRLPLMAFITALFNGCRAQGFSPPEALTRRRVRLLIHPVRTTQPRDGAVLQVEASLGHTVAHVIKILLQNHGLYGKAILTPPGLRHEDIQTQEDVLRAFPLRYQLNLRAADAQPPVHALPRQLYDSAPAGSLPRHMFLAEYFDFCYSGRAVQLVLEWPEDRLLAHPTLRRETWEDLLETGRPLVADGEAMDPFAERYSLSTHRCAMCRESFSCRCAGMIGRTAQSQPPPGCPDAANCLISLGRCGHVYHLHCMQRWQALGRRNCPLCGAQSPDWVEAYSLARCEAC